MIVVPTVEVPVTLLVLLCIIVVGLIVALTCKGTGEMR